MICAIVSRELVTYYTRGTPEEIRYQIEGRKSMTLWRYTDFGEKLMGVGILTDPESILLIREEPEASPIEEL